MGEYDVRKHIVAVGHVQGCGFRYYTTMAARQYHLTGWVMNCDDGTVEMEVQGRPGDVNLFMEDIKTGNRFATHARHGRFRPLYVVSPDSPTPSLSGC